MSQYPTQGGAQPPGMQLTPEQLLALAALAGNINVEIGLASGTKYKLAVSVPTADGSPYSFVLTEIKGNTEEKLADFEFKDSNDFSVEVNIPAISEGGVTIKGGFLLKQTPN
jgi:hypothetical protein